MDEIRHPADHQGIPGNTHGQGNDRIKTEGFPRDALLAEKAKEDDRGKNQNQADGALGKDGKAGEKGRG